MYICKNNGGISFPFIFCQLNKIFIYIEFKVGARGLRSIMEAILNDAMFELPSDINATELVIDRAYAEAKLEKSGLQKLHVGD